MFRGVVAILVALTFQVADRVDDMNNVRSKLFTNFDLDCGCRVDEYTFVDANGATTICGGRVPKVHEATKGAETTTTAATAATATATATAATRDSKGARIFPEEIRNVSNGIQQYGSSERPGVDSRGNVLVWFTN